MVAPRSAAAASTSPSSGGAKEAVWPPSPPSSERAPAPPCAMKASSSSLETKPSPFASIASKRGSCLTEGAPRAPDPGDADRRTAEPAAA